MARTTEISTHLKISLANCDSVANLDGNNLSHELVNNVFGNEMLLETVLYYALHSNGFTPVINRTNLCNFRLVSTSWKNGVSRLLKLNRLPLYVVRLTAENSLNLRNPDKEKILCMFVKFVETIKPESSYKGFRLILQKPVFRQEIHEHLVTCLRQIGQHLVELFLAVPKNGGSFPGLFPNSFNIPKLRKFTVVLPKEELQNIPEDEKSLIPSDNATFLLQSLLFKSRNLQELAICGKIPSHLHLMEFPSTLQKIKLEVRTIPSMLKCLVTNDLPSLTWLTLGYFLPNETTFELHDLLFKIFEKVSHTLRNLQLYECFHWTNRGLPVNLGFPVMHELGRLEIDGAQAELETEIASISATFPKMSFLRLDRHTDDMLEKWTVGSPTLKLTKLSLGPTGSKVVTSRVIARSSLTENIMNNVHKTFPCITNLSIYQTGDDFQGLQTVFREMRQLKRLSILSIPSDTGNVFAYHWDAVLIGVPLQSVDELTTWTNYRINVKVRNKIKPSIQMLRNLECLRLEAKFEEGQSSLVSDISFIYALNEMPNLKVLHLIGGFWASYKIRKEWKSQCREIVYQKTARDGLKIASNM